MSYRLSAFNGVTLPVKAPVPDVSTDPSRLALVRTSAGYYDAQQTNASPSDPPVITQRSLVTATTPALLLAAIDTLRQQRGRRGVLTATMLDASTRWRYARLVEFKATRQYVDQIRQEIELRFQCLEADWWGAAVDSGAIPLDTSPHDNILVNAGNRTCNAVVITVTAQTSTITAVTIAVTGISSFTWTGSLLAGKSLVIDCGARTVKNDGVSAFSGFALDGSHVIDDWLRLTAGNTTVTVTRTGGGNTSSVQYTYSAGFY